MASNNGASRPVQNQDAFLAIEAINTLVQKEMDVSVALRLRKMIKNIQAHIGIVQEQHRALLDRCAVLDDAGQPTFDDAGQPVIREDQKEAYRREYSELMLCEWEDAPKFPASDLQGVKVKTATLLQLDAFLED